jgi:L-glyceraldehyde 3-phosphate reductase
MTYTPAEQRYDTMIYNRCGRSGLKLPALSLGLWNYFGGGADFDNARALARRAFDLGITHFDLANNYGPPPGSAEENFGRILAGDFAGLRDEVVISTKAAYPMWKGPYGMWGSRKHLLASLDQSLKRMGLDYVDIFYSHRFDPETPLEETMGALDSAVRQGKALYVGISSYSSEKTAEASGILRQLGTPCIIHQPSYSMFNRWIEGGLLDRLELEGIGCIAFSPLAQGLLTTKYLQGVPQESRLGRKVAFFDPKYVSEKNMERVRGLNDIARARGQSLAQMALAWALRDPRVTSALIGASRPEQLDENVAALRKREFSADELQRIDALAVDIEGINRWAQSSSYK